MAKASYQDYVRLMHKIADVRNALALLGWDQETYMPPKGAAFRAQQSATLSGISHDLFVAPATGDLLHALLEDQSLDWEQRRNVTLTLEDYDRACCYNTSFVERKSMAVSNAHHAWVGAREANDFGLFRQALEEVVTLTREEATLLGYTGHPYDALLNLYEPGATTAELNVLFADIRRQLVGYVQELGQRTQVSNEFMYRHYPERRQWDFGIELLKEMQYDLEAGRQDISAHPFTTNFSMQDVRVTTRVNEQDLHSMIWGCIHEGGHALYEQGLLPQNYGLPAGEACSLGIHESQSRLWENMVGRSLPYWKRNYPRLQAVFPESLGTVSLDQFYKGINQVNPSLIRTEADELTYHFHIMIRFEIEKSLMDGSLEVRDLPEIWRQRYQEYLGLEVKNDFHGVLQDIHWCHGSIGYFPTYSLGSFYAVQFYNQALKDIPDLEQLTEQGNLLPLRAWLGEKIHRKGRLKTARELCTEITGEPLNAAHFMRYARNKFDAIYNKP